MSEEKIEHPCGECKHDNVCSVRGRYKRCKRWLAWLRQEWTLLQKYFGINVSNRHKSEGDDLNE
jgi:hypothetical protein